MQSANFLFQPALSVESIGSVRHFFCSSSILLSAPPFPAYELLYIASQEAILTIGQKHHLLKPGGAWLLQSSSPLTLRPACQAPPCVLLISFSCPFPLPSCLPGQAYTLSETEHRVLAHLLLETKNSSLSDDPIRPLLLEQLLRLLLQRQPDEAANSRIWQTLLFYLKNHLNTSVTIAQICHENSISRSRLEKIFHDKTGCGAITFFARMKIETAKELIRIGDLNFTQIAAVLGYSSVHYFSRQFKKRTKMTPTEYSLFIRKYSGTSPAS